MRKMMIPIDIGYNWLFNQRAALPESDLRLALLEIPGIQDVVF